MKAKNFCCRFVLSCCVAVFATLPLSGADITENVTQEVGDSQWIWSPAHTKDDIPAGDCFFRKSFQLSAPEIGEVHVTADNRFELFVNGKRVGQGEDWRKLQVFDVSEHLVAGKNTVAVRVTNAEPGVAGLAGRVLIKEKSGTYEDHPTNSSWRTSVREHPNWNTPHYADHDWLAAASYGTLGATLPWGDEVVIAGVGARFSIEADFAIERLLRDEEVGSLIAMTFDSQGSIYASREGGPLMLITDSDHSGNHDSVSVFCDKIKNVQGILALGSRVFAVGDGPEGVALYRLRDVDRNGVADEIDMLVPIRGSRGEHGAHAVRLGPDGLLYVIIGNHARVGVKPGSRSPYGNAYEGDLLQPRHEDPRGHAVGIPAPGGTIFRTDTNGSFVELVAGGMRNSYDFAFSSTGEIFTYDSDMEWDIGAPWYRPTRVNHTPAGAELGWRSGWAKWPEYYLDSLPAALNIGPGSPTGVEFYEHHAFPAKYQGAMFACDWATGRIHAVRFQRKGATYVGTSEVFVAGRPLNVTDIAVGPDGALYFCTGGRGTDGGVYRVRYTGKEPASAGEEHTGIELAIKQPQLESDWARAKVANVKKKLDDRWDRELDRVARDKSRSTSDRIRSLDLMIIFGPWPSDRLLVDLTDDPDAELRGKATSLMFGSSADVIHNRVVELLEDPDPLVRRIACETIVRLGIEPPGERLVKLLGDSDRFVAFAARRALEQQPLQRWGQLALSDQRLDAFCQGAIAVLSVRRDAVVAQAIVRRTEAALQAHRQGGQLSEQQLLDVLRVTQVALSLGELSSEQVPTLGENLLSIYPSGEFRADRELARLLVSLQVPGAAQKFATQLDSDLGHLEKMHIGAYASRLNAGWNIEAKLALMRFYEQARGASGGYSVSAYLELFARDFFANFSLPERRQILAAGEKWPTSSLSVLAKLPAEPGADLLAVLRDLDRKIDPLCADDDAFRRLRVGIIAVLGRTQEEASGTYLRQLYTDHPELRHTIAMSMTQNPGGENWPFLVDSIKTIDGRVAQEVLASLANVAERPSEPEPFRQVILSGLRLGDSGGSLALKVLDRWAGREPADDYPQWQDRLAAWQGWYAQNFPGAPPAELPTDPQDDKWSYEELLAYLQSPAASEANPRNGQRAFQQAQCANCHRCSGLGDSIGPDLTNVFRRFQKREILEAIVYPSHNISDQYAGKIVMSHGRTYAGMVVPRGEEGITVLLSDGEKVELDHEDVDEVRDNPVSVMPTGLLNVLTLSEVADLFAFLESAAVQNVASRESRE